MHSALVAVFLIKAEFSALPPGVADSATFIERFNAGNFPDGIVLDDVLRTDSVYQIDGFICRAVPVAGNEDICLFVYSRKQDGKVYAIRIDEIVDSYTDPTKLIEISDYLYKTFFIYVPDDEREKIAYAIAPLVWHDTPVSNFFLDYKCFKHMIARDAPDQPGRCMRTLVFSRLSYRRVKGIALAD